MQPRGGTTKGPPVTLMSGPSRVWEHLREAGLEKKERDRRAILAMAGPYRTSFNFLETVGFTPDFTPDQPYASWATEYVYVLADEPDFISLQHVIVMFFQDDGGVSGPMVVKHWRQDWRYQDRDLRVYRGDNRWQQQRLDPETVRGKWSQAVFQVDDSPRYESLGAWRHSDSYSVWESADTWRPLPRREFSVRDDYDLLAGSNRHTILPAGWVHEEDNLKAVLEGGTGEPAIGRVLARETGINRYQRIVDFDWSGGDAYWQRAAPFWREVRAAWQRIYAARESFRLREAVDGQRLFEAMFELAEELTAQGGFDARAARRRIEALLDSFLHHHAS